ncbi:MAG: 30S ribosomal protein S17 [Spirochaetes bacterium]|nr:30S ribosomal protein S17 [Spirochaetota bacterium]
MSEDKKIKSFIGLVVSDKMDKTIVVSVEYNKMHRLYKKYVKRRKKFKVHDEKNDCKKGDMVKIIGTNPISKEKKWKLAEIISRAK